MIKWAVIFALVSLVAGVFGFTGVAAGAAGVAKVLFFCALAIFVVLLGLAIAGAKALKS